MWWALFIGVLDSAVAFWLGWMIRDVYVERKKR